MKHLSITLRIIVLTCLFTGLSGHLLRAGNIPTDTLLFTYSLNGQTRKFEVHFDVQNKHILAHWRIFRNEKWLNGSFQIQPEAIRNGNRLTWQQPAPKQNIRLDKATTFGIISQCTYDSLTQQGKAILGNTPFVLTSRNNGLIHAIDHEEGAQITVRDDRNFPLIVEMQGNPVGINWTVNTLIIQSNHQYSTELPSTSQSSQPAYVAAPDSLFRLFRSHPEYSASIYRAYPIPEEYPKAHFPAGYTPFYISHYGRHGSRRVTADSRYTSPIDSLRKYELTALGKDVLHRLQRIYAEAKGRSGSLTRVGEQQHKGIAERMYNAYPEVFSDTTRRVSAQSSLSVRCIMSMSAFTERLKELHPSLHIDREAEPRDQYYLSGEGLELQQFQHDSTWIRDFIRYEQKHIPTERFLKQLFVHPEQVKDGMEVMKLLYWIAADQQNIQGGGIPLYDIFTTEELYAIWQTVNYRMYVCNGNCTLNQGIAARDARPLLKQIISRADAAIRSHKISADLRFGHDTNLLRLLNLMKIDGAANSASNPDDFAKVWNDFRLTPMAGNLQLIFARNTQGHIIVRILLNEVPQSLPIQRISADFYDWGQLRKFWMQAIEQTKK